jgi:hypothetical protein
MDAEEESSGSKVLGDSSNEQYAMHLSAAGVDSGLAAGTLLQACCPSPPPFPLRLLAFVTFKSRRQ